MGKDLILEIGTEEIPAAFLPRALRDMEEMIRKKFLSQRIPHGKINTLGTPRRLLLHVADISEKQEDQTVVKIGPARIVSFDDQGTPSKAAVGFAKSQGVDISELTTVTTEKGEHLCARKEISGKETRTILPGILSEFVTSIPFRKSMRWSSLELRFARPIHWILAIYGGQTVPFKLDNIESGNRTCGHRFMSPAYFEVGSMDEYLEKTRENFVIVDHQERKKIIVEETKKAAKALSGQALINDELLETVTFLVEYPTVISGSFDRKYLELPQEVLITSMISHQKYFPLVDEKGKLMPNFIVINNTLARDPTIVRKGNEKVIRARLADAKFFFEEDRKIPLGQRVENLRYVVFHTLLGTSYDKIQRFRELAAYLAEQINPALKETVDRTATLAKTDLDTHMVGEFAELQGVMGREYALLAGENPVVAKAIYEHYLPVAAGGDLPETDEGAIVSIADKMDTIVGFFGVNILPTGDADPYALRRQALGIINIILHKRYYLRLEDVIGKSLSIFSDKLKRPPEETKTDVLEFFKGRLENQLISQGYPYDVIDAVLSLGVSDILRSVKKIEALKAFKSHPDFKPLAIAFKRVGNIIRGCKQGSVNNTLFEMEAEKNLYDAFLERKEIVFTYINNDDYQSSLTELARLRKPVDVFFDSVLVMTEDEKIRSNRLSLLIEISTLFHRIADFSKIGVES
ncbi:MAG: glycine--tRNA ligase subunit beta [Syntrophales bacterium]|nr:glycine--tRNA ligase subunit beta [Syntrophales bacterium]